MSNEPNGKTANALSMAFYVGVAGIALAGQLLAIPHFEITPWVAVPLVVVLELGGIALAARADYRRRKGENAYGARILSALVACWAVGFNWYGHADNKIAAGGFAFMSALGYLVWLLNSGDNRRDQLRATNQLAQTAPAYGIAQWLKHPWITRRARALAVANPHLGLHGSLRMAADNVRQEQRQKAIAEALKVKLAATVDPVTARIAVATYDLDRIAAKLAAEADYDGLTALIAAEMTPVLLTATATAEQVRDDARKAAAKPKQLPGGDASTKPKPVAKKAPTTAERVAKLLARKPELKPVDVAKTLGVSERTAQRYWPKHDVTPEPEFAGSPA